MSPEEHRQARPQISAEMKVWFEDPLF